MKIITAAMLALASAGMFAAPASSQDADAAWFKGKSIRLIVGYGPGGGYDAYARMLAPHIAKRLGANIVVENQPGAGGVTALNKIYAAKGDALKMMIVNGTAAAMSQLVGQKQVRYDLAKMGNLGTIAKSPWVWLVHKDSPIRTAQDAIKSTKEIRWAASGPIDGLSDGAWFTCEALKLKCKVIIGYKGSRDAGRAVVQGEMDAIYVSDTSGWKYVKAGDVRAVAVINRKPSRFFKNVPTIFSAVKLTQEAEKLFDFHSTVEDLGRILVTPPGVEAGKLKVLQKAVQDTLNDKELQAMGEKSQRYVEPESPETTLKNITTVVAVSPEEKAKIRKVLRVP
jgi:tripartite-type tricarboxylate transporter receptor subunit TctC